MNGAVVSNSGYLTTWTDPPPLDDFLAQLGRIPRWAGGTTEPWCVLQHSLLVHNVAGVLDPEVKMQCLLHDFAELRIGDIPGPAKWEGYHDLETMFVELAALKFGLELEWGSKIWHRVAAVDSYCGKIEWQNLTRGGLEEAGGRTAEWIFIDEVLRLRHGYNGGALREKVWDLINAGANDNDGGNRR